VPVFAEKGETLEEYWDYCDRIFFFPEGTANMILDDGGDASMYILLGARAEAGEDVLSNPSSEEETVLFAQIKKRMEQSPGWFTRKRDDIRGVSEETTTGVNRLYQLRPRACCRSRRSTSTTASPSRSSTTNTAARKAWLTAFAAAPTS
jgi:adenosylhomocysteinase